MWDIRHMWRGEMNTVTNACRYGSLQPYISIKALQITKWWHDDLCNVIRILAIGTNFVFCHFKNICDGSVQIYFSLKFVLFHDPKMISLRPKDPIAWNNTDYAILRIESDSCAREVKRHTAVCVNCINLLSSGNPMQRPLWHMNHILPTECIYVFHVILGIDGDFFFLENVYCFEVCSTEIHLDTRITKCSQFTILHELCLV